MPRQGPGVLGDDSSEGEAVETSPSVQAAELKSRAESLAAAGDFVRAVGLLRQAVALDPSSGALQEIHAQVLLELGRTWEAVQAAARAAQLLPDWAEAHVTLGRAQLNYGEPILAEASFDRALELEPEDAEGVRRELEEVRRLAARQRALGPGTRAVVGRSGQEGPVEGGGADGGDGGGQSPGATPCGAVSSGDGSAVDKGKQQ